jgi:outer membrane protein
VHAVTLEEAIERAFEVDPTLRASKLNQMATEENISIARSRFLPQVTMQGSSSNLTQTTTQEIATGGSNSRSFTGPSVNHQLVIRQALFKPKDLSSIRSAELQNQYLQLKYKIDVKELKSKVINAWIDLETTNQMVHAYLRPLELMQIAVEQEVAKFEKGESTKDTVAEANSQFESARASHNQAIQTLINQKILLEKKIKLNLGKIENNNKFPQYYFSNNDKELMKKEFIEESLDLKMVNIQLLIQQEKIKQIEAEGKPTLELLAAFSFAINDATSTQGYQYKNKQIGLQYVIPLYAGGMELANIKQAVLIYEASNLEREALEDKINNEFEKTWLQLKIMENKIKAIEISLKSAEEQLNAIKKSVELGVKTISDLANSEMIYSRRNIDYILMQQEYKKNPINIKKYIVTRQ